MKTIFRILVKFFTSTIFCKTYGDVAYVLGIGPCERCVGHQVSGIK